MEKREENHVVQRVFRMKIPGKKMRGRPKRRLSDNICENMEAIGARREDTQDRMKGRTLVKSAAHFGKSLKKMWIKSLYMH